MGFGLKNLMAQEPLKKEERKKYVEAFNHYDKDKNGQLDVKELAKLCKRVHFHFDGQTVKDIMKMTDLDGTGTLSEGEFLYFMANMTRAKHTFEKHDKDGNGTLDRKELQKLLNGAGFEFNEKQTAVFFPMVDKDNSNSIYLPEFLKLAVFLRFTTIQFILADSNSSGSLNVEEVHKHLPALGLEGIDEKTVKKIVNKLNAHHNGKLKPNEFSLLVGMLKLE